MVGKDEKATGPPSNLRQVLDRGRFPNFLPGIVNKNNFYEFWRQTFCLSFSKTPNVKGPMTPKDTFWCHFILEDFSEVA